MIPLTLRRLAEITGGDLLDPASGDVLVDGPVVTDSREAGPGSLYVARVGEHADGHVYVPAAKEKGAVAALVTTPVEQLPAVLVDDVQEAFAALAREVVRTRVADGLRVVGITGSSGKTSTKDLLAHVLSGHGETVATIGSLNSEVGVPLTLCRVTPTTAMLVVEMGARGIGHVAYLTDMAPPHVGIVLNVGTAHLGEFGSREAIARAKSELVAALTPEGLAVLNADDDLVRGMTGATPARVCLTGRSTDADVRADDIHLDALGAPSFTLHVPGADGAGERSLPVHLALLGEHQVDNALAVVAAALELGMTPEAIVERLESAAPASRWRMERHVRADGVVVVNDAYNANPDSMSAALRTLARMECAGRRVAVLGAMYELGPDSADEHRRMGALAAELGVDVVVAVGEDARVIADGATRATAGDAPEIHHVDTLDAAESLLDERLGHGDVVLLKSSRDAGLRLLGDRLIAQEDRS
ncbi:UDP-N-acetylmuramoyl-tripeptide--D-alanyl-D-alanine ligase [Mobilicoccus pelagius]|uniref:UDP-N-acetylmuramoyl-tripeptide--D-alanyl-D-alanine ligase n=1 Tax=Mobilicoccus pelagius NBRC 104925 TaxID=1089455 RepID=H5UQG8_9MICO|nr:UDP-N-acetylmuramoyl-tripeptide--D-alanyl-D-alanine ligase [Mobilicoccus pelagius]GAB47976.1 UDP-N-acetylmuramoyl-tripeptide--D-alanyl-D-alanine ligase [Mobilicoccus pelagius NBRC 104925]